MRADEERTVADEERLVEGLDGAGSDMSRVISLSDGVFAFALTFLVVSLVLPTALSSGSLPPLNAYLAKLEPAFVGYFLSFFIIAGWWAAHHRIFSPIVRYDSLLTRLNNLFLLEISVTPFLVGILFEYGPKTNGTWLTVFAPQSAQTQEAVQIYAITQVIAGLTLLAIWRHSTRDHRLVEPRLPREWIRATERDQAMLVLIFAASFPLAFLSPFAAELVWIFMVTGFGRRLLFRRHAPPRPRSGRPIRRADDDPPPARA